MEIRMLDPLEGAPAGPTPLKARWRRLDAPQVQEQAVEEHTRQGVAPMTAVFSLTRGSGNTMLVGALGRMLTERGETVVLAETSSGGTLAELFGMEQLAPGLPVKAPLQGGEILLVRYDFEEAGATPERREEMVEHLLELARSSSRVVLDVCERAGWLIHRLAGVPLNVLIPVTPTMSSVISLQAVERFFRDLVDGEGRPIQPRYLINQFDESRPVHRDVRDFLRRQVGDRLLPFVLRSATEVEHSQGMPVMEFAPKDQVTADLRSVADWLRVEVPPAEIPLPAPSLPERREPRQGMRWLGR